MDTTNKIIIGVDDQVIELTGEDKEAFLADRKATADAQAELQAIELAKVAAEEAAKQQAFNDAVAAAVAAALAAQQTPVEE